ncbi:MAG: hypothetical protein QM534_00140 [Sediminibacterium sp.]|nr:hypothetical protein [Sediminibacterium sp.]
METILKNMGLLVTDKNNEDALRVKLYYITNPDGSVRWVWPKGLKKPLFLKFYLKGTFRSKVFYFTIRFIFLVKLQHLIFKSKILYVTKLNDSPIPFLNEKTWSLYTGTTGPNQKYIIYHQDKNREGSFIKFAISRCSETLLKNEQKTLDKLQHLSFRSLSIPKSKTLTLRSILLTESPAHTIRTQVINQKYFFIFKEFEKRTQQNLSYNYFSEIHQIPERIEALQKNRLKIPCGITKKLTRLHQMLQNTTVKTHLAHGDFTCWNILTNNEGDIYAYDWELSNNYYPKGFDFFHFTIQKGILVDRVEWRSIYKQIEVHTTNHYFRDENFHTLLSCYLLITTLNYLEIYERQAQWHVQVNWLLNTWNDAISDQLAKSVNSRELLIMDIFDYLRNTSYAGLKLPEKNPENLSEHSDIDLLIHSKDCRNLISYLRNHSLTDKISINRTTSVSRMLIYTRSGHILNIDLIHQIKRKHIEFMNVNELLSNAFKDEQGIKKTELIDLVRYIGLFYGLNNATVPTRYNAYQELLSKSDHALDNEIYIHYSGEKTKTNKLAAIVKQSAQNRGFNGLKNRILYGYDCLKSLLFNRGLLISFSGVDGAGKTTIIEKTRYEIEKKLRRRVIVLRHRPSVLPILSAFKYGKTNAEKKAISSLPRLGKNNSLLSSAMRFAYYYTDYVLGQFYIYCKHILRGDIVLYDRYYFDFINDSIRSNIRLPKWLLKSGYSLLLKPKLNFFLYADPATILKRKKELDAATIKTLTYDYLTLFKDFSTKKRQLYLPIENIHLDLTMKIISTNIQSKLI